MRIGLVLITSLVVGPLASLRAQCPSTDFTMPPSACAEERIAPANLSSPGSYLWDFCSGDFGVTPTAVSGWNLPGVNGRPGIEFAFDGKWYGFVTGTFSSVLYRVEFDNGLTANPTSMVNLGSLSGTLNQPGQIRLVKEGTQWLGLVHNTGGQLLKLDFGSQLNNTPTVTSLISGLGYINSGLALGRDPNHGYVATITDATNEVVLIRLGFNLSTPNPITDVIRSTSVPNPNNLGDIDLIQVCGNWHALATNLGNGNVYRMDFGGTLFSAPAITQIGTLSASNPGRIRLAREGEEYFFFVLALDGSLTKGALGTSMASPPVITNEGTLGALPSSMYGLGMVKEHSTWTIVGVNQANGTCYRINYSPDCSASPPTSTVANPETSYSSPGTYFVSVENLNNGIGTKTKSISVAANQAPDIAASVDGSCATAPVQFTSSNSSGTITSYSWNFGDSQVSSAANPTHTYASPGTYEPLLMVTASNGCSNSVKSRVEMFVPPVSDFALPAASPFCTNQAYSMMNTSTFDPLSAPSWEWRLDGNVVGTLQDIDLTFASSGLHEIRLKAQIPGCSNVAVKTIPSVVAGPVVSFSVADDCAENAVPFVNATSGADAGYSWDFGDGSPPTTISDPTHLYSLPGTYDVTLHASNSAGCNNTIVQNITIYSLPEPNFSVGAPPFSCSNNPTLFQNLTAPLTDSNIAGWSWNFGDPSSNTSTAKEPSFTYSAGGVYSVSLTALSDAGCSQTTVLPITIGTSPVADFTHGPACINVPTQFADSSTGGVQSRFWKIGTSTFTTQSPAYTYTVPGNYTVSLTVTGTGGCTQSKSKQVIVAPIPALTLQVENPCVDQPAVFTLVESGLPLADPVTQWQWNIGGTLATGNPATAEVSLAGATPVSVITTHQSGCVYTKFENPVIFPSPVADFVAFPDRGDAPLTVQFENHSIGATSYQWLFSDRTPATSSVTSPVYTFLELGNYSAQLTALNTYGCADSKSIPIEVLVPAIDLQVTSFSLAPDAATGKLRPSLTILNGSNVPITTVEVALSLSDRANVSETIMVNLQPGASATKTLTTLVDPVQFTDPFVCVQVISEKDGFPGNNKSCINLSGEDYIFEPYPNPSSGTVRVDWVCEEAGMASVTIRNSQGRKEYYWETPTQPGLNQSVHDLSFLAAGIYFVTVQTANAAQTRRIVRQ